MFPYINFNVKVVSDHYADHNLFDNCADHHMLKSYVVILIHNTVVYIYLHSYKLIFLFVILEICWVSKETLMHNSNTIISHCICHSIVKILYIGKGKMGIEQNWNWKTKMHNTMYYHYAHWNVCMYLFLVTMNF